MCLRVCSCVSESLSGSLQVVQSSSQMLAEQDGHSLTDCLPLLSLAPKRGRELNDLRYFVAVAIMAQDARQALASHQAFVACSAGSILAGAMLHKTS